MFRLRADLLVVRRCLPGRGDGGRPAPVHPRRPRLRRYLQRDRLGRLARRRCQRRRRALPDRRLRRGLPALCRGVRAARWPSRRLPRLRRSAPAVRTCVPRSLDCVGPQRRLTAESMNLPRGMLTPDLPVGFARRYITRPAEAGLAVAVSSSREHFQKLGMLRLDGVAKKAPRQGCVAAASGRRFDYGNATAGQAGICVGGDSPPPGRGIRLRSLCAYPRSERQTAKRSREEPP